MGQYRAGEVLEIVKKIQCEREGGRRSVQQVTARLGTPAMTTGHCSWML